jgi:hypothetical protein
MQDSAYASSDVNPDKLARRMVQCAYNRDGLPEIFMGCGFLLWAGMSWSRMIFHGLARNASLLALVLAATALCLASGKIIRWVRNRYLIQRVGYVQLRPTSRKSRLTAALVASVIAVFLVLIVWKFRPDLPAHWLLPALGFWFFGFKAIIGRLPRFWITGGLDLLAGCILAFLPLSDDLSTGIFFAFLGIVEILSGLIVLLRLIREPNAAEA